jgi:hypothetical protein
MKRQINIKLSIYYHFHILIIFAQFVSIYDEALRCSLAACLSYPCIVCHCFFWLSFSLLIFSSFHPYKSFSALYTGQMFLRVFKFRICNNFLLFFWKFGIRPKYRLIWGDQSHRSFAGALLKARVLFFYSVWTSPPKFTPVGIELETSQANSKDSGQHH